MSGAAAMRSTLQRLNNRIGGGNQGPVRGRVVKQYRKENKYCIDVEVLNVNDEPDPNWSILPEIEIGIKFGVAGTTVGIYGRIGAGTLVRVGFYDGDLNRPYLDDVLCGDLSPNCEGTALLINCGNASIVVSEGGGVTINSGFIKLNAAGGGVAIESTETTVNGIVYLGCDDGGGAGVDMLLKAGEFLTWLTEVATFGGNKLDVPPPDMKLFKTEKVMGL